MLLKRVSFWFAIVSLVSSLMMGCATEGGDAAKRGAKWGAASGAALGLAMGAITGEPELMMAGMAAGAATGAASGAMYEYDQHREDQRTRMMADAIGGAKKGETVDDAGKRHLEDFIGEWNVNAWALMADGKKITATGKAKGVLESTTKAKIDYFDLQADGKPVEMTGFATLTYDPKAGFELSSHVAGSNNVRKFVGEYMPEGNRYQFYQSGSDNESVTGVIRSNVRMEVRVSGANLVVVETFTMMDGKEVQMQSYRLTRS